MHKLISNNNVLRHPHVSKSFNLFSQREKSKRIEVQLLKDNGNLGVRGQIINVKPAFMRNYLNKNNGACYITKSQGPRIPVVEPKQRSIKVEVNEPNKEEMRKEAHKPSHATAMSLEELSNLFSNMKSSKHSTKRALESEATFEASSDGLLFTLSELRSSLPKLQHITTGENLSLPISKNYLVDLVYENTGIKVATDYINLSSSDRKLIDLQELKHPGEYIWTFSTQDDSETFSSSLIVH